jgi:hypothetical protein
MLTGETLSRLLSVEWELSWDVLITDVANTTGTPNPHHALYQPSVYAINQSQHSMRSLLTYQRREDLPLSFTSMSTFAMSSSCRTFVEIFTKMGIFQVNSIFDEKIYW